MAKNIFRKNVSEPWFTLIKINVKTCEGRLNKGDFSAMKTGDVIVFENDNFGFRSTRKIIKKVNIYLGFKEYLETEGLDKCLPGVDTIEEGVAIYHKYYSKEDEKKYSVAAILLEE